MSELSEEGQHENDEIDVDKLIVLFEARPVIYNITLKEHHNQDIIASLWQEIAIEMGVPATRCKAKWTNLRSSYSRYLRDLKKLPSGSGAGKKKKWHLADIMDFMKPYVGPFKKGTSNFQSPANVSATAGNSTGSDVHQEQIEDGIHEGIPETTSDNILEINPRKKTKKRPADMVAEPMIAFLKSRTQAVSAQDDSLLLFLRSLHNDINKLSAKRQRNFKSVVLRELNKLLDEQEEDESRPSYSSSPSSERIQQSRASSSASGSMLYQPPSHNTYCTVTPNPPSNLSPYTRLNDLIPPQHRRTNNTFIPINYEYEDTVDETGEF